MKRGYIEGGKRGQELEGFRSRGEKGVCAESRYNDALQKVTCRKQWTSW